MTRFGVGLRIALLMLALGHAGLAGAASLKPPPPRVLNWEDLVPDDERSSYTPGPPPPAHDYLNFSTRRGMFGEEPQSDCDGIAAQFSNRCGLAARQAPSSNVNQNLDGLTVKLSGYIVPMEVAADGSVREFFLASYLGACIHVPPPPPNQMVYVKLGKRFSLRAISDPYAITGVLHVDGKITALGAAAYSLDVQALEHLRQ